VVENDAGEGYCSPLHHASCGMLCGIIISIVICATVTVHGDVVAAEFATVLRKENPLAKNAHDCFVFF
jgi:hypothetical protein